MTKPRKNTGRELYGLIGSIPEAAKVQKEWNRRFAEQARLRQGSGGQGIDATMNIYPTTKANLPERLSEMFHFDRRAYIVGKNLSRAIIPLLDEVEPEAWKKGVQWVENEGGVLRGSFKVQESNFKQTSKN